MGFGVSHAPLCVLGGHCGSSKVETQTDFENSGKSEFCSNFEESKFTRNPQLSNEPISIKI